MSDTRVQIDVIARDHASAPIDKVSRKITGLRGNLLQLSKDERLLKRTTRGVYGFASALDVLGNTNLSPLIADLTTVGLVAEPLGKGLKASLEKIGPKIAAMAIPLAAQGTTVGTAVGSAMGLGMLAGFAGGAAVALFSPAIFQKLMGTDPSSVIAGAGKQMADKFIGGFSDGVKARYADAFNGAVGAALAAGSTNEQAMTAGKAAADAFMTTVTVWTTRASDEAGRQSAMAFYRGFGGMSPADAFRAGLYGFGQDLSGGVSKAVDEAFKSLDPYDAKKAGEEEGIAFSDSLRDTIKHSKREASNAMRELMWAINHPGKRAKDITYIESLLGSKQLKTQLASTDAAIRHQAELTQTSLQNLMEGLTGTPYDKGAQTQRDFNAGILSVPPGQVRVQYPGDDPTKGQGYAPPGVTREGLPYNPPHYAKGGYIPAGAWGEVNENGREYIQAGRKGVSVTPAGGHGHNIYLNGRLVGQAVDEYLGRQLSLAPSGVINRG